jgi:hypothetical protein
MAVLVDWPLWQLRGLRSGVGVFAIFYLLMLNGAELGVPGLWKIDDGERKNIIAVMIPWCMLETEIF